MSSYEEVAAIVVTHNSEAVIGPCLDALRGKMRAVVVDNASSDRSVAEARKRGWVEVVANPANRGFAAAVNLGARAVDAAYLLLLNPDAVLDGEIEPLLEACREYGLAAGCLVGPGGAPQAGFAVRTLPTPSTLIFECLGINRLWPQNAVNRRYRCLDLDLRKPHLVEQPAGAFLMIRRDLFETLGGFDELFWPVWFEDVDFCRRAAGRGVRAAYVPAVRALHQGGHSVGTLPRSSQRVYWYGSLLKYAGKHYRSSHFRAVCGAVILGSVVRLATGLKETNRGDLLTAHAAVIRAAAGGLLFGKAALGRDAPLAEDGGVRLESSPMDSR